MKKTNNFITRLQNEGFYIICAVCGVGDDCVEGFLFFNPEEKTCGVEWACSKCGNTKIEEY